MTAEPIVAFLKARYDEEEHVVRTLDEEYGNQVTGIEIYTDRDYGPIIAIGQKRALADIESKRQLLDEHYIGQGIHEGQALRVCTRCSDYAEPGKLALPELGPCRTLRLLALPHADHLDFDPAWSI